MSMHGGGGGAARSGRMGMRGLTKDRNMLEHQIKKGTFPRVLLYAKQYKKILIIFFCAVITDAIVSSVSPLLLRAIIDKGII